MEGQILLRFVDDVEMNMKFHRSDSAESAELECRGNCSRKKMSFDSTVAEFSQQSIVSAMEKFARSIANMNENILVPCKLMDAKVGSDCELDRNVAPKSRTFMRDVQSADLHNLYQTLNTMKTELIWGSTSEDAANFVEPSVPKRKSLVRQNSARRISITSMPTSSASSISTAISDTDSEIGTDQDTEDSGVDTERDYTLDDNEEDCVQKVALEFRRHLFGLHKCLEHLTDTANYLTRRYHVEIGTNE